MNVLAFSGVFPCIFGGSADPSVQEVAVVVSAAADEETTSSVRHANGRSMGESAIGRIERVRDGRLRRARLRRFHHGGWRITFAFASDDVVLFPNSAYGADASVIYAPEYGGRAFRLRDRGYDATLERYATKRVGFNVRTKSNASGLRLTFLEINGDACVIMEST